ncbi:hypothetical protein ScPMuIL_003626 [Solemya velum]
MKMEKAHRDKLLQNREQLVSSVRFCDIKDNLQQEGILDMNDIQEIESSKEHTVQMENFLDILPFRGPYAYTKFYNSLGKTYRWMQDILDKEIPVEKSTAEKISPADAYRLTKNRVMLVDTIKASEILTTLAPIISMKDKQEIEAEPTDSRKNGKLLDLLPSYGDQGYKLFYEAIKRWPWLQKALDETDISSVKEVGAKMKDMNVQKSQRVREPYQDLDHPTISILTRDGKAVRNWKSIARRLQVSEADICDIEYTNRSTKEQLYQAVLYWKRSKGRHATVENLIGCLREEGCNQCAGVLDGYSLETD